MRKESKLTDLLALMVLFVFALCIVVVLLTGTQVYRRLLDKGEAGFESRTGVRYVTTRVRQAREVVLEDFGGCPALVFPEEIDGERYRTLLYWYDGYVYELFCTEDAALSPEDGEKVLESEGMLFSRQGDLLTVDVGGERIFLNLSVGKEIGR